MIYTSYYSCFSFIFTQALQAKVSNETFNNTKIINQYYKIYLYYFIFSLVQRSHAAL